MKAIKSRLWALFFFQGDVIPCPAKNNTAKTKEIARAKVVAGKSISRVVWELSVTKNTLSGWLIQKDCLEKYAGILRHFVEHICDKK